MRNVVAILGSLLLAGCVAPGSAIGRIGIRGALVSSGRACDSVQITLPKDYGLGGLDLLLNKPEDFGNRDQTVQATVVGGEFSYDFQPMVYHISFWLLPPLGPLPRHPPPPVFSVSFSATPDEVYLVGFDKGVFRYEVYSRSSHAHLEHDHASWFIEGGEYVRDRDSGHDRWVLRLRIRGA